MTLLFALVDCNNFYASCERVFNPRLIGRPVVVLSSNDGCVIARSNEAKACGIPMGAPLFAYRQQIEAHNIAVCSANFSLYGDMSERIMNILEINAPQVEVYSIDESFLDFEVPDPLQEARTLRAMIDKWTGIPVSIGIAATKTLAKAASRLAKKEPHCQGIYWLDQHNIEASLKKTPVGDVWGIGRGYEERLLKQGVESAWDLRNQEDTWIKKQMGIHGLRTAWELRGVSCFPLVEASSSKQSITCSHSFGKPVVSLDELSASIAYHAARAAKKARQEKRVATSMIVFFTFHPFRTGGSSVRVIFSEPTAYSPEIIRYAKLAVQKVFTLGVAYRKSGVILEGLVAENSYQRDLFARKGDLYAKQHKAMALLDRVNEKFGKNTLFLAAEGLKKPWQPKREKCSARYTTRWNEILTIYI